MRKLSVKILHLDIDENKRIIAIGDIHAHKKHLVKLLEKINFSENDELFLLGDYIERGLENLQSLRYVMELSKLPNVHVIIGNNDAFIFSAINEPKKFEAKLIFDYVQNRVKHFGACTITDMCNEIGIAFEKEEDVFHVLSTLKAHFSDELDFVFNLPTIIDTQNFTFVHGGLTSTNLDDCLNEEPFHLMKNDEFIPKGLHFDKFVVVGHWPTILYKEIADCAPIFNFEQKIISIDGGCGVKTCGQLNAIIIPNINSQDFSFIAYDELKRFTATKAQDENQSSINILWGKNEIEFLENKGNTTYIHHYNSGKNAYIPSSFIFNSNGKLKSYDFSDYKPKVSIGDELAIIESVEGFGTLVKINSTIGWYNP